jgi:tetratricopeptide (TPR) repeat protein
MGLRSRVIVLFLFVFSLQVFAQPKGKKPEIEDADEHIKHGNYLMALPIYRDILKKDPDNKKVIYNLGLCYLNTNFNRTESIKQFENLVKIDEKFNEELYLNLGKAYHLNNRFDDAIKAFEKYKLSGKKEAALAERHIQMCNNAKQLVANPENITFTNLGKEINSEDPDYYPFISADETFMAFTSRRKENLGGKKVEVDGYHPSDIYYSKVENGKWVKAINPMNVMNSAFDEQVVWLKPDGSEIMVYLDHIDKFGDLYTSKRKPGTDFVKPKPINEIVNKKIETSGCFADDGNTVYFARRENVDSKSDIYSCRKLPTGQWGEAYKLPIEINTEFNEDFPFMASDGVTLYFASEGHNSMGGYDLYKSTYNPNNNTWSKAKNLGYPVNSTADDRSISLTPDKRVGYISTFRPGGIGDLDIYRIRFNENQQVTRIITGKVFLGDSASRPEETIATITARNKSTNEEWTFIPHTKTAKYVIALGAGTYVVTVTSDGFEKIEETLVISDIGTVEMEKNKNYTLKKK